MFDMSWGEIMVIGGVALIVIGPKDLPKALRTVGQMTAKVRKMAGEFQSQFMEAMREAELDDVRKEVEGLNRQVSSATSTAFNPIQTIRDELKGAVDGPATSAPLGDLRPGEPDIWGTNPGPLALEEAGPVPQMEALPAAEPSAQVDGAAPILTPAADAAAGEPVPSAPVGLGEPPPPPPPPHQSDVPMLSTSPGLEGSADMPAVRSSEA